MTYSKLKFAHLLYALAFVLALAVRLSGAGQASLSAGESELALQALEITSGQAPVLGPHPAYISLTTLLMFLFPNSGWVVRFWPALAGSLLVFLPLLFRARLSRLPALLLAFFLALDPGLLAVSRQADGSALALLFVPLALGLWLHRRAALAGIAAGMALLSGPAVWPGLLGLALAFWAVRRRKPPANETLVEEEVQGTAVQPLVESPLVEGGRRFLIFALATVFFAGTLFFTIPNGLSAMAASLPTYLGGWNFNQAGEPLVTVLAALLVYEILPLFLGLWGAGLGWWYKNPVDRFLLVWWAAALVLVLLYPARQVQDIAWSLLPLWALAARQIGRLFVIPGYDRLPVLGQALLSALILGFTSITLAAIANNPGGNMWEYRVRLIGAAVMLVASTGLIAWGWSRKVALRGLALGLGVLLGLYLVSNAWNTAGLAGKTEQELWTAGTNIKQGDLLLGSLHQLDLQGPTITGGPELVVVDVSSPAVRWLLRGVRQVSYSSQLPADASPALVITPEQPDLALAAMYRGQSFILDEHVAWDQLGPADWFRWLVFRKLPADAVRHTRIVLWARADFFPGGLQAESEQAPPEGIIIPGQEQPVEITGPE